jgi:HD-like signal output (HDOD) protein
MPLVTLSDLKKGMILAEDVFTPQGRFLLSSGTVVQNKQIRIIKMWGITEILVEETDEKKDDEESAEDDVYKVNREYVDRLFAPADPQDPVIQELKTVALKRRILKKLPMIPLFEQGWDSGGEYNPEPVISPTRLSKSDIAANNINLASFPDVYRRIVDVLEDPKSSATRLAEAVSRDSGLTGKLLKLVNSSAYGFNAPVDSITKAITLIGFRELGTLAVGIVILKAFRKIPCKIIDMKSFWMHSLGCGIISKIIARKDFNSEEEQFFIAGLLHDIGRLILLKDYPELMTRAIIISRRQKIPLYAAEQRVFGFDHTEILELLLPEWNFPSSLQQIMSYHHNPEASRNPNRAAVVHAADAMTNAFEIGSSAEYYVPPVSTDLWRMLGLSEGTIESIINQSDRQLNENVQVFFT